MRNFTKRTSVRILTQVILTSLFVIQNHCGLLAASSLIQKAAFTSSMSSSHESSMPCHQGSKAAKESKSKECNQECCTELQAVFQNQQIKVTMGELPALPADSAQFSLKAHLEKAAQKPVNETPSHLSFQRSFYKEAFPSNAPPEVLLA